MSKKKTDYEKAQALLENAAKAGRLKIQNEAAPALADGLLFQTENAIIETLGKTPEADTQDIDAPTVLKRPKRTHRRELKDIQRETDARKVIAELDHENELFGFTKGRFSIIDLISATLEKTGPANTIFSTWTAANADVSTVFELLNSGAIIDTKWLVDLSLQRRQPELANAIRAKFGFDSIRVARNHAKFFIIHNADWKVVIRTSMNLNFNPRFEDFTISHDPELFDFLINIIAKLWKTRPAALAFSTPYEIHKHWEAD